MRVICCCVAMILAAAVQPANSAAFQEKDEAPSVARLEWMSGCWSGGEGDGSSEEHWTSPAGGTMIGMNKAMRGGRVVSFEFMRIARSAEDRLCYLASPAGGQATAFCLLQMAESRVVFENPEHDFPQRVIYSLDEPGRLRGRIEGSIDGEERSLDWVWHRCDAEQD